MSTCPERCNSRHIRMRWIEQDLDHFDSKEKRRWKMRYFERLDLWKPGGPIYLFIGGEGRISPHWAMYGLTYELAQESYGAIYISEHRYYGASKPFNDTNVGNFKFLTVKQALADLEYLLKHIKEQPDFSYSKIVVIGCSYSGNLAAWMRLLYPDLVDAAIAGSAPVLAKKDFHEYYEKVSYDYELFGLSDCWESIQALFRKYDRLLQSDKGVEQLKQEENICDSYNLTILANQQRFLLYKLRDYATNAQYHTPSDIFKHCTSINNSVNKDEKCLDFNIYYEGENDDFLAWIYQTCTELGYFHTATSNKLPFTKKIPLSYYTNMCKERFGPEFDDKRIDDGIRNVNQLFGGLNPNVTKVVFTNGDIDPWSALGIVEDLSDEAPAIVIPCTSHCKDMHPSEINDSEELREARRRIKYFIKKWINYY
ncbi:unnamed protein product, partial [Brenthis ino]